jgi:hypothetical protein
LPESVGLLQPLGCCIAPFRRHARSTLLAGKRCVCVWESCKTTRCDGWRAIQRCSRSGNSHGWGEMSFNARIAETIVPPGHTGRVNEVAIAGNGGVSANMHTYVQCALTLTHTPTHPHIHPVPRLATLQSHRYTVHRTPTLASLRVLGLDPTPVMTCDPPHHHSGELIHGVTPTCVFMSYFCCTTIFDGYSDMQRARYR